MTTEKNIESIDISPSIRLHLNEKLVRDDWRYEAVIMSPDSDDNVLDMHDSTVLEAQSREKARTEALVWAASVVQQLIAETFTAATFLKDELHG